MQWLPIAISSFALVVAMLTYWDRWRERSAGLVVKLTEYYDSLEMYEALRTLNDWRMNLRGHKPTDKARSHAEALLSASSGLIVGGPIDHKNQPIYLDAMRRRVDSYFQRLCQFREQHYLRHRDFRLLVTVAGEELMVQVVAPLLREKIGAELRRLELSEAERAKRRRWLTDFERHLTMIQDPTRRTVWLLFLRRGIRFVRRH